MRSKKSGIAAAGVAFTLAATVLGLPAGPASATTAGLRATATIERLPGSAVAWAGAAGNPPPATCVKAQTSPTFTAASRLDWCAVFVAVLSVYQGTTLVGTADIGQTDYASWKVSSRTWNPTRQVFSEEDSTGVLAGEPLSVFGLNICNGGCTITSNGSYTLPVPLYPVYSEKDPGVDSPGSATVTGDLSTSWTYTGDGLTFPPLSETTVGVRCDSIYPGYRYKQGCANPSYQPTYVLSSASYPDVAKFDKAQLKAHPSYKTLTRATPAQKKKNRRVACKGFVKKNPTDSCDEFPYASTTQGGAGAAQEHVNEHENEAQGGNLVGFYNANRLFYGEKFSFKIS
jgi:Deoxyribonuclease NucA/NucB